MDQKQSSWSQIVTSSAQLFDAQSRLFNFNGILALALFVAANVGSLILSTLPRTGGAHYGCS
jgi:hypothetical protein